MIYFSVFLVFDHSLGFIVTCLLQPTLLNENIENLTQNDERSMDIRRRIYQSQKVQGILKSAIPLYDQLGVFD